MTIDDETFDSFMKAGIDAIPREFREKIRNVVFVVQDVPSAEQRKLMKLRRSDELYGLYEGIPLSHRGLDYGGLVMPDKITIFKRTVEMEAETPEEAEKIVRETVWHELGHHFGLDEEEVERRERERDGSEGA